MKKHLIPEWMKPADVAYQKQVYEEIDRIGEENRALMLHIKENNIKIKMPRYDYDHVLEWL